MAAQGKQPKMMSSRLSGMKFMQRSHASPTTPSTPAEPPSKKQRLSNGSSQYSPVTSTAAPQDRDRNADSHSSLTTKDESKWYLSFKPPQTPVADSPLRIISAGFASLDAAEQDEPRSSGHIVVDDEDSERPPLTGRKSFGNFNRKTKQDPDASPASDSGSESEEKDNEDDDEDDPTGVKALIAQGRREAAERIRAERKAKKQAEAAESAKLAAQRRTKERNLNKIQSISSGGGRKSNGPSPGSFKDMVCHQCGEKGHPRKNCPR